MSNDNYDRRRFLGSAAMTLAAAELRMLRPAGAQSENRSIAARATIKPGTKTSFGSLKQIDAGLLNVGYAEAGPASWYIVSKLDGAIAPDEERFFAKRMKATTTELIASHVSMLSKPKEVAAVIMDAAAKAQH